MRIIGKENGEVRWILFTAKPSTVDKLIEKAMNRIVANINANPLLVDENPSVIQDAFQQYTAWKKFLHTNTCQKLFVFRAKYHVRWPDKPYELKDLRGIYDDPRLTRIGAHYVLQYKENPKRLPRRLREVIDFDYVFPSYEFKVFVPIPPLRKLPYPKITKVPVVKGGTIAFVEETEIPKIAEALKQ